MRSGTAVNETKYKKINVCVLHVGQVPNPDRHDSIKKNGRIRIGTNTLPIRNTKARKYLNS
jgi:hypothetical protein